MVVTIIEKLQELGLTEYEARIYIALLRRHPATAYEAARNAGVPTSKVYQVLDKLTVKGLATEVSERDKTRYVPLKAGEFVELFRSRITATLGSLERELSSLSAAEPVSYIWNITAYEELLQRAAQMIGAARNGILVSAWNEELTRLARELSSREQAGIKVAVLRFGEGVSPTGAVFSHPIEDTLYKEKGGRGFTLVTDGSEALTATVSGDGSVEGAWSRSAGFVTLAEDYIKHDIYIMKIVNRFDPLLRSTFGERYRRLRDVFTDTEEPAEGQ
jgi:sugar-specific transcriptional regulator TrmB